MTKYTTTTLIEELQKYPTDTPIVTDLALIFDFNNACYIFQNEMTEEEQELFDLLKKDKLTKEEEKSVRLAAKSLLEKLYDAKNKILIQEFDYYKSERLFTKNQIFDYKINRINGPINDTSKTDNHYYDVSYSVKTIAPAWIAGNGKNGGLWVNSKSEFYNLIKNNDQYILNRVGGL